MPLLSLELKVCIRSLNTGRYLRFDPSGTGDPTKINPHSVTSTNDVEDPRIALCLAFYPDDGYSISPCEKSDCFLRFAIDRPDDHTGYRQAKVDCQYEGSAGGDLGDRYFYMDAYPDEPPRGGSCHFRAEAAPGIGPSFLAMSTDGEVYCESLEPMATWGTEHQFEVILLSSQ